MKYNGPPLPVVEEDIDNGHWLFPVQMGATQYEGFIYVMYHRGLNLLYLGMKTYRSSSGKTSGWRTYTSSSETVLKAMKETSHDQWDFICIEQYKTKGGLSYAETWSLCFVDAPLKKHWLNRRIEKIEWKSQETRSIRHINRLTAYRGL